MEYAVPVRRRTGNENIKLAAFLIGVGAVGFIGYKIYKKVKKKVANHKETKMYKSEIVKSNLSLPDSEFHSMASGIETALNQRWDDDEERVYAELSKLKTVDDWKKLIVVFGSRTRNRSLFSPTVEGGLKDWLVDALSGSEIDKVNQILTKIGVSL